MNSDMMRDAAQGSGNQASTGTPMRQRRGKYRCESCGSAVRPLALVTAASVRGILTRVMFVAAMLLFAGRAALAQSATDIITGSVRDTVGRPVPFVTVRARSDDGRLAGSATTDSVGRYTIRISSGTGRYVLSANRLGYTPSLGVVQRAEAGRVIERDFALAAAPAKLEPVRVRERQQRAVRPRRAPGDLGDAVSAVVSELRAYDPSDIAAIAATHPGVLNVGGDTSGLGLSIGGQPASQTSSTLDGATYGGASLPPDAIRHTNVITSTYDVARGQFTGGQVDVTTRNGTSIWAGAAGGTVRSSRLQFGATPSTGSGQRHDMGTLNAGGGGPLIRDRLTAYGAVQGALRQSPAAYLDAGDVELLRRLHLSPDSVRRFQALLGQLGAQPAGTPSDTRVRNGSALLRLDLALSDDHALMTRLDWRGTDAVSVGTTPFAPAPSGGTYASGDAGVMAELTSRGETLSNRARAYVTRGSRHGSPVLQEPAGVVQVASADPEGAISIASLTFGGNPYMSARNTTSFTELSNEVKRSFSGGTHQVKLGALVSRDAATLESTPNALGTFRFATLADLEAGRPSEFTRTLTAPTRRATSTYGAVYLGDEWRQTPRLWLTAGLRYEAGAYSGANGASGAFDSLFHMRVGAAPTEHVLSPRVGFSYEIPTRIGGPAGFTLRGGTGQFRGRIPVGTLASALNETGDAQAMQRLVCIGDAAPAPRWSAYRDDPEAIASQCASGASTFAARTPSVTGFGDDFGVPRVWHSSLDADVQLPRQISLSLAAVAVRGVDQPLALDMNLDARPQFLLAAEDDRPVFVPVSGIDAVTGGASPSASRMVPSFSTLRALTGGGRSSAFQFTIAMVGVTPGSAVFGVYYTGTHSRDMATGIPRPGGGAPSTAADPSIAEWAPSDMEVRHAFQLSVSRMFDRGISVFAFGRLTSGFPFTPMVDGDVNGDGLANDRAFVFNPASGHDTVIARGMRSLLDAAPPNVRGCLIAQVGRVALRNSCTTGWAPSLDVRLNARLDRMGSPWPLRISVLASNVTAGLDYLLHGPERLRGWGQFPIPDRTLLTIRGFDPGGTAYRYAVNPQFGKVAGVRGIGRSLFGITVQARMTLGTDPAMLQLVGATSAARAGSRSPDVAERVLSERIVNVPAILLASDGALALNLLPSQVARLQQSADSLAPLVRQVVVTLTDLATADNTVRRTGEYRTRLGDALLEARGVVERGITIARATLTDAQWDRVPAGLRRPLSDDKVMPTQEFRLSAGDP
jgi:hypothetical protein